MLHDLLIIYVFLGLGFAGGFLAARAIATARAQDRARIEATRDRLIGEARGHRNPGA